MKKYTSNKARYQLFGFLDSSDSIPFNLDAYDIALLNAYACFMDFSDNKVCTAGQKRISQVSRLKHDTITRRNKKLEAIKLISILRGKEGLIIEWGDILRYR